MIDKDSKGEMEYIGVIDSETGLLVIGDPEPMVDWSYEHIKDLELLSPNDMNLVSYSSVMPNLLIFNIMGAGTTDLFRIGDDYIILARWWLNDGCDRIDSFINEEIKLTTAECLIEIKNQNICILSSEQNGASIFRNEDKFYMDYKSMFSDTSGVICNCSNGYFSCAYSDFESKEGEVRLLVLKRS